MRALLGALALLSGPAFGIDHPRAPVHDLTRLDAAYRASIVRSVAYEPSFRVDGESPDFSGEETIRFDLAAPADGLTLDFDGGAIEELSINGSHAEKPDYNGHFLTLPRGALRAGENLVRVAFRHPYSTTGSGYYRFKDPEDGRVYLYTDFEPYDADRLLPCFDQPDLKATFTATVEAPADWQVVSAAPEEKARTSGKRKTWAFATTPRMSTYVFSLHAGPYHVWRSTAGAVPLRLFARESVAARIDAADWFKITREGLAFYGAYYAYPYPFRKYDQLVVPDFNSGAMENIGAVTFSERYVHRGKPTLEEREDLAATILHEMAHMWFGDLVTLRWWDGLWLNESFATYMEALSSAEATEFKRAWLTFFLSEKEWAYAEDQRVTTHPVEGDVPDTDQAFANFDGITYGKGASVLKQLAALLGPEKFRDGVRLYLKSHAYGNSEEKDFFGAMEKASGVDLADWTKEWLNTSGVDTVRAEFSCDAAGATKSFALLQSGTPLRRHRTRVALYNRGADGRLTRTTEAAVGYEGARTEVPELVGKPCPVLVYPNAGDDDYVKVELDGASLREAQAGMSRIADPLLRGMLWYTLWEMVRDGKWPVNYYADAALAALGSETDFKIADAVGDTIYGYRTYSPSVLRYLPAPDYARYEEFFWAMLLKAEPGSDFQKLWFDGFVKTAETPDGAAKLRSLLEGRTAPAGLTVDQDRRWNVVARLSELGAPDSEALVSAEEARDPSDEGVKQAARARAARPDPAAKRALFDELSDPADKETLGLRRAEMEGFFPRSEAALQADLAEPFFRTLAELNARKDDEFLASYSRYMLPADCSREGPRRVDEYLAAKPPLKAVVLKSLRNLRQEEERCVRVRALLGANASRTATSKNGPGAPRSEAPR